MLDSLKNALRDAYDIARRARNAREVVKVFVPRRFRKLVVLNEDRASQALAARPPSDVAAELKHLRNQLRSDALDDRGQVDYARLHASPTYDTLRDASRSLTRTAPEAMASDSERVAFWINLYNVLAIHGVLALELKHSVMEVPTFFSAVAYRVGRHTVTLDDIENGVLRCNAPHPVTRRRLFSPHDPRLALCPTAVDPRIHAALVCASTSCPPVAFYDADHLDDQLDLATRNYIAADVEVDEPGAAIVAPIVFDYYRTDFTNIAQFMISHADGAHRDALRRAFDAGFQLRYRRYDWSLNAIA